MSELPLFTPRKPLRRSVEIALVVAEWLAFALIALSMSVLAIALAAPDAFAQEASTADRILSSPALAALVEGLLAIFGPVVVGLVLAVLARLYAWLGLKQTEANRQTVEQVLALAVRFARARFVDRNLGAIAIENRASAIGAAADYAMRRGPRALGKVGVTDVNSADLQEMIEARIDDEVLDPAADAVASRPIGFGHTQTTR